MSMMNESHPTWNKLSPDFFIKAIKYLLLHLSKLYFCPPHFRPFILRLCGHKFQDIKTVFIGADVLFDHVFDARTYVGSNVTITCGARIMNHFLVPGGINQNYVKGDVYLEDGVFIGMNVLIVKPVRIGRGSVIGAGSVVLNDIPAGVIAAGIPARVIKNI